MKKRLFKEKKNKRLFSVILSLAMAFSMAPINSRTVHADTATATYETLTIDSSSLNGNTVNGLTETSQLLDNYAGFYVNGWQGKTSGGFPANGQLTENGVPYQLACGTDVTNAFYGNDSIQLKESHKSQTMDLGTIGV